MKNQNYYLLQMLFICFTLSLPLSISALPISDGAEKSETKVETEKNATRSYRIGKSDKASAQVNVLAGVGLFLMPFAFFIPFAWGYALSLSSLWLTALILIGIATLVQAILVILGLGAAEGAEGKLKLWGTSLAWFSLIGGSISLIWGFAAGISFLWILGIPYFILAFIPMILLVTHPNAK